MARTIILRKRQPAVPSTKTKFKLRPPRLADGVLLSSKREGYSAPFIPLLERANKSHQLDDLFANDYAIGGVSGVGGYLQPIQPMYPMEDLCRLPIVNNTLLQCIKSYVTNIDSYGQTLEYIGPEGKEDSPASQMEKSRITRFLGACSPEHSFTKVREMSRHDIETTGNRYFEVARNLIGEVSLFDHLPGSSMRMTKRDPTPVQIDLVVYDSERREYVERTVTRHFRRYIQQTHWGTRKVFFKEFGDPRPIDPTNGEVNAGLPIEKQATEVLHDYHYVPGVPYGLPHWIGQLPSILGSRESEIVNLNFFRENAIPAMAVLVSGGALTDESFTRIQDYISAIKGKDAMQRVMVIEAAADETAGSVDHSQPAPKIDMKPMISERQQEGLFQAYDEKNAQKVRSSMRLPPIYVGLSDEYARATAYAAMLVAESQVWMPERGHFDDMMQTKVMITFRPKFWRFKSVGASLSEPDSLSIMLSAFAKQGGMTPNIAIKIANKMLDVVIEPVMEDWGDIPFDIVMEYVRQGREIKGLEGFLVELEVVAPDPAAAPGVPANQNEAIAAAATRRTLRMIREDLVEAVAEGVQRQAARQAA